MQESYLDITKSVMISSPAGSGKTEKLARRYIALLRGGSDVERILAITFTDKAAAEMKERILSILKKEDPELFEKVREKMPRMRISTIHSFCLKLLKRFCIELGMDLSIEVMDSFNSGMLWEEAVYESLLEDGASGEKLFYDVIRDSGIKGWNRLYGHLKTVHGKRPDIEFGIRDPGVMIDTGNSPRLERILAIYTRCLERYTKKKRERHCVDYNDLELMAYEAVSTNQEWQNILFSFDEHTDHILVDEFQDTSSLQWLIVDKLTEEWRAGLGAKRDSGVTPTIFLVGDDKQSIYSFRGANSGIFKGVRKKLSEWLGDEYHFVEIKENYRSLPAIVDFVNTLFGRLMPGSLYEDWKVEYVPFEATRQGDGKAELIVCDSAGTIKESRKLEASAIARKIKVLCARHEIYEGSTKKLCSYGDMAVLLRNRTHLSTFEDALRREGIPFIVVKGIGFYSTPEIGFLRDLLFVLIDPQSDYSLFNVLRSPLFSINYNSLLEMIRDTAPGEPTIGYLYALLDSYQNPSPPSFSKGGQGGIIEGIRKARASLDNWIERSKKTPYAVLLEEILTETGAWRYFHEKQRYVNIKKFIKLVEDFEARGLAGLEIREKLIKASSKSDESKANVNTEGMDAVKIMTVHASKGLQFPMVFLPCLDEGGRSKTGSIIVDNDKSTITLGYEEDSAARKDMPVFRKFKEKAEDEEKRLFYVAATRSMDYLCMSGVLGKRPSGKLAYILDAFNLTSEGGYSDGVLPFTLERIRGEEFGRPFADTERFPQEQLPHSSASLRHEVVFTGPVTGTYSPPPLWRDVTEEIEDVRRKHGDDWVALGRAFHTVFEGMSKGSITNGNLGEKLMEILKNEVLTDDKAGRMRDLILSDLKRLGDTGYLRDIILPRENSYAELPFILELGHSIFKGRIDRIIIKDNIAHVYDYKTYPISEKEIPELSARYSFQMDIYKKAVGKLFSMKTRGYLFFTHELRIIDI